MAVLPKQQAPQLGPGSGVRLRIEPGGHLPLVQPLEVAPLDESAPVQVQREQDPACAGGPARGPEELVEGMQQHLPRAERGRPFGIAGLVPKPRARPEGQARPLLEPAELRRGGGAELAEVHRAVLVLVEPLAQTVDVDLHAPFPTELPQYFQRDLEGALRVERHAPGTYLAAVHAGDLLQERPPRLHAPLRRLLRPRLALVPFH
mmetsp:Transcript_54693/g.155716  ORF Transcript_54693/g.155716 Transcript_54693/m.155716 type:complete len:205 (+) Transcript_54693:574-1188(+)